MFLFRREKLPLALDSFFDSNISLLVAKRKRYNQEWGKQRQEYRRKKNFCVSESKSYHAKTRLNPESK